MAEIAAARCGAPVTLELSIANVDKPTLDFLEIDDRLAGLSDYPVLLTRAATFVEKAASRAGGRVRRRRRHDCPDRRREILRREPRKARLRDRRDRRPRLPVPGLWPCSSTAGSLAFGPQSCRRNCAICAMKCAKASFARIFAPRSCGPMRNRPCRRCASTRCSPADNCYQWSRHLYSS